jgi:hypothetical protein
MKYYYNIMSKRIRNHHSHLSHTRSHHSTLQTQKEWDKTHEIKIRVVS